MATPPQQSTSEVNEPTTHASRSVGPRENAPVTGTWRGSCLVVTYVCAWWSRDEKREKKNILASDSRLHERLKCAVSWVEVTFVMLRRSRTQHDAGRIATTRKKKMEPVQYLIGYCYQSTNLPLRHCDNNQSKWGAPNWSESGTESIRVELGRDQFTAGRAAVAARNKQLGESSGLPTVFFFFPSSLVNSNSSSGCVPIQTIGAQQLTWHSFDRPRWNEFLFRFLFLLG